LSLDENGKEKNFLGTKPERENNEEGSSFKEQNQEFPDD
jgi:hypothetical protein